MDHYKHLLSEGRIGQMELRNRIILTAMGVSLANPDGSVNDRIIAYHEEQAKGGAGLIITGVTGVALPTGGVIPSQTGISRDEFIPGLKKLADRVHAHGAKIAAQLHHGGLVAGYAAGAYGEPLWAPSIPPMFQGDFLEAFLPEELAAFMGDGTAPQLKVLEKADIELVIRQYAEGARRAKEAGFDAVEIHGGHGYLISSFLSPSTNKRTDEYGGPLENRARLMLDVLRATKELVGQDFPVWMKLDSCERGKPVGTTIEDACQVAQWLEEAGADGITVTAYHDTGQGKLHSGSNIPQEPEANVPAAIQIKRKVNIPVIALGRIVPESAERHIAAGDFDFVAMGRRLLADPHLPNKLKEGKEKEVRPCIYCYTCVAGAYIHEPVRCAVNSTLGLEYLQEKANAPTGKNYVVVGGGPGGMESARRLALAGNRVTLIEQGDRLGGTLRFASLAYKENEAIYRWLREQVEALDVDIRLKTKATPELVSSLKPDHVIVATGAVRSMPDIPGNDQDHVFSGDDMRQMILGESSEALKAKTGLFTRIATKVGAATGISANLDFVRKATHQWMPLGDKIVIIGGELVGVELAEFLAERKREVTVIEESNNYGRGLTVVRRMRIIPELRELGVGLYNNAKDIRIEKDAVVFTDAKGESQRIAADHVIVAKGARGDSTLANALRSAGLDVTEVGDGTGVGYIEGAIRGASRAVLGEEAIPQLGKAKQQQPA